MPHEIMLAGMMTTLDLEIENAMHYHDEGYKSDNNYRLPPQVTKPICIYSVLTTEASFDVDEFATIKCLISHFTPRCPRSLPFQEVVCWHLTFKETPPPTRKGL